MNYDKNHLSFTKILDFNKEEALNSMEIIEKIETNTNEWPLRKRLSTLTKKKINKII